MNPELFIQNYKLSPKLQISTGLKSFMITISIKHQVGHILKNGTGFPTSLFQNAEGDLYDRGSGGKTHHELFKGLVD